MLAFFIVSVACSLLSTIQKLRYLWRSRRWWWMQMVSKSNFYTYYRMENEQRTQKNTLLIALNICFLFSLPFFTFSIFYFISPINQPAKVWICPWANSRNEEAADAAPSDRAAAVRHALVVGRRAAAACRAPLPDGDTVAMVRALLLVVALSAALLMTLDTSRPTLLHAVHCTHVASHMRALAASQRLGQRRPAWVHVNWHRGKFVLSSDIF